MKKRLLSAALAIVMVCALLPTGALAVTVTEALPCTLEYDWVGEFSEGLANVTIGEQPNEKWGLIDKTGQEVLSLGRCYWVEDFSTGLVEVWTGDPPNIKQGFVDKTGKEVVPLGKYDYVEGFSEGLAAVELDDKWGYIDNMGQEIIPLKYENVHSFSEGLASVKLNGKWRFIDATGTEVIPCEYDWAQDFSEGLAAVEQHWKYSFIDKQGQEVISVGEYQNVHNFSEGLALVSRDGKWGFVDKMGREVVACKYDHAASFSEGLAMVEVESVDEKDEYGNTVRKRGCIDKTGKEVVPLGKYDHVESFSEGLAAVLLDGKCGYIDKTGREVVPCKYSWANDFSEGLATVELDGKWGFLAIENADDALVPAPEVPAATAYASTQTVTVDGKPVTFHAYALKDENGNDTNYIKLRDVAAILNGSAAQFQVGWDGAITITTQTAYTPNGSENIQSFTGNRSYTVSQSPVTVDGLPTGLEAITLTDANGGGYTYFKLRDLGAALGFHVDWSAQRGIYIETK